MSRETKGEELRKGKYVHCDQQELSGEQYFLHSNCCFTEPGHEWSWYMKKQRSICEIKQETLWQKVLKEPGETVESLMDA